MIKEIPVLICGGGSVGLSLAAELGWRNVECLVFDQGEALNPHPRANAVANRTMEYYRRWGIDQTITEAGVPPDHPADYYWVSSLHGRELHHISLPPFKKMKEVHQNQVDVKDEHTWSPYLKTITGQNEVEHALLNYVQSRPSLTFSFNRKLVGFEQDDEGVTCEVQCQNTGELEVIRCKYLLACDGGRSFVREQLDIALSGRSNLARFVSIYFRAPDFKNCHKFGQANIFFPLHRDYAGFILNWDGGTTFTYHLMLQDKQQWNDIDPTAAIDAVLGASTEIDVISTQPWTAHALVADQYRNGRIFLAGDAAHLFTPTGGFGMNTGVSDTINLAWKIKAMLEGWGGEHLLDSYFAERHAVGVRNTSEAADCFDCLHAVMKFGDELDEEGIDGDLFRDQLRRDLKSQEKLIASSGTLLGYRYEGSPIVIPDGTTEPEDNPRTYIPVARPGHRAPHIWLDEGVSILDKFGPEFTLLKFEACDTKPIESKAAAIGLPLHIVLIENDDAARLYETKFVLVRPDLMIAWRSNDLPEDLESLLNRVRGTFK
jgi:2-polyprenyl-6-methoxyphenol hydroxylase-like FAD-dependent oxidoreductase